MSSLFAARPKVSRFAGAAVRRARLTVVPQAALGRTEAARTPFVVLVLGMLVAGVVGLLMFNTHMQQASFTATRLQNHLSALTDQRQSLELELDGLRDPQRLATVAKKRGMVAPTQPAFIRLSDGRILGTPAPATTVDGSVRINPLPHAKPASINPRPIIVKVKPGTGGSRISSTGSGAASAASGTADDRKKASTQADSGAAR